MTNTKIYILEVDSKYEQLPIKAASKDISYFSNLSKLVDALKNNLALQGWAGQHINYTAIYRSLKVKERFVADIRLKKVPFFRITIYIGTLNPALSTLGIGRCPE